jgi:N-succinyldiaminopimelate aminotransferase
VIEAAVAALRGGENQYAPLPGAPALRAAVLDHQRSWYGLEPEDVLVTFGATEGIAAALLGPCDPGDEAVVLEPYYDSHAACISFAGAARRAVTLRPPGFEVTPGGLGWWRSRPAWSTTTRTRRSRWCGSHSASAVR